MALIVFKTFNNPVEAHLLRTQLENEGILSFVFDENMISINPFYNVALGGVKVMIHEKDIERASEIVENVDDKI